MQWRNERERRLENITSKIERKQREIRRPERVLWLSAAAAAAPRGSIQLCINVTSCFSGFFTKPESNPLFSNNRTNVDYYIKPDIKSNRILKYSYIYKWNISILRINQCILYPFVIATIIVLNFHWHLDISIDTFHYIVEKSIKHKN